ncbi:MAG: pilus assembly protein [Burkholderiales bacterium]
MRHAPFSHLTHSLYAGVLLAACALPVQAAPLALSNVPLFVTTSAKANVLLIFSNANNMDEDPTGLAVGSDKAASKSEIARIAARNLVSTYTGKINMGLMAYQQKPPNGSPTANYNNYTIPQWLSQSPYDASYNPSNYVPGFAGARNSLSKAFKVANPTSPNASGACTTTAGVKVDCVYYNVNLPFYTAYPAGNTFCYSNTASAFNNGETFPGGPWDNYACYAVKTGTSDAAPGSGGDGYSSYLPGSSGAYFPTDSDLAQNILDFGTRVTSSDVGPTWFSNRSPGLGYLHVPIANLDAAQAGKLNLKLATSVVPTYSSGSYNTNPTAIAGGNTPTNPNAPLQNAGLSPITGTFMTATDYFNGAVKNFGGSQGGPQAAPPDACGKDFVVFLTNGLPNVDSTGAPVKYDGVKPYSPAEVANAVTAVSTLDSGARKVQTYVIGFALPAFTKNYFTLNPPNPLDQMAAAGGTASAYYADDLASLNAKFSTIFNDILGKSGAAAAVAVTSGTVIAGGKMFQGQFNSVDWSGDLVAYNTNPLTGAPIMTPTAWNAASQVKLQNYDTGRSIITIKPSTGKGIAFRWPAIPASPTASELDPTQVTALNTSPTGVLDANGGKRLNYIRGDTSQPGMRARPVTVLGDIVDSAPYYVGAPASNYSDELESAPYSTFRTTYLSRTPMIYAGANDGMLHGFDAATGQEKLAYVPSPVYANLTQLTSTTYSHRYFVDGSPTVIDGFYGGAWHTVLVSGLAGGGQGFFALDVTDPGTFSEVNANKLVQWEFTDANDKDLGYSYSQPSIVKLNNGTWAAIFGNGYNNTVADSYVSTSGDAVLYIVDLQTGALIKKIDTGVGSAATPNGLATPTVIDADSNGTADFVYAGDLKGNLWKFDISGSTPGTWKVAYSGAPLFTAKDGSGTPQPITAAPDVVAHPSGFSFGYIILFGTGKYLETTDPADTSSQTFYGIQDNGATVGGRTSGQLVAQTVTATTVVGANTFRSVSSNTVDWTSGTVHGWYLDLPSSGERVVSDSITRNKRVIFTTIIPSTAACSAGGTGYLMELDLLTGGAITIPTLDVNGDGIIDVADKVGGSYPAGVAQGAIPSAPRLQNNFNSSPSTMPKCISLSDKTINCVINNLSTVGRTSWHEITQ